MLGKKVNHSKLVRSSFYWLRKESSKTYDLPRVKTNWFMVEQRLKTRILTFMPEQPKEPQDFTMGYREIMSHGPKKEISIKKLDWVVMDFLYMMSERQTNVHRFLQMLL